MQCTVLPSREAQVAQLRRAFDIARGIRGSSTQLEIAVLDRSGILVATGKLLGYSQAAMFAEMMRRLGYDELLPRTAERLCKCSLAFMEAHDAGCDSVLPQHILDLDTWAEENPMV